MRVRVLTGWLLAVVFIFMSGSSFAENGELTTESWGYLLLSPMALVLALSTSLPWESPDRDESDWDEDDEDSEVVTETPDPVESGYDVPVL